MQKLGAFLGGTRNRKWGVSLHFPPAKSRQFTLLCGGSHLRGEGLTSHAQIGGGAVAEVAEGGRHHRAGATGTRVPDQQLAPGITTRRREHLLNAKKKKRKPNIHQTDE